MKGTFLLLGIFLLFANSSFAMENYQKCSAKAERTAYFKFLSSRGLPLLADYKTSVSRHTVGVVSGEGGKIKLRVSRFKRKPAYIYSYSFWFVPAEDNESQHSRDKVSIITDTEDCKVLRVHVNKSPFSIGM